MHHGSLRTWAVLHAGVDIIRDLPGMHMPASADGLHGVVLGHLKLQHGQIKDLACFTHIGKGPFALARLALVWNIVDHHPVWL